jgi:undecaprenyl-diphosphatase
LHQTPPGVLGLDCAAKSGDDVWMLIGNPLWQSIVLGILQGLSEFLPISSSAHLLLLPWLAGWNPMGLDYDVALHFGTLLSVLMYFRRDLLEISRAFVKRIWSALRPQALSSEEERQVRIAWAIGLGTIPALVVGVLFNDSIEHYLRSPLVTVVTLAGFGLLLLFADRMGKHVRTLEQVLIRDGVIVGIAQTLALVPGVSRSGITITAALFLGFARKDSARFSFLLAAPVVLLAALKSAYDLSQEPQVGWHSAELFGLGIMVSFLSGFLCIKYFLRFLQERTYLPFVVYRLLLACFVLVLLFR